MIQTAFLEAVIHRRHRILGRKLHAFCLYDALFLTLAGNPLWTGDSPPTRDALEEAVLICSLPPERFLRGEIRPRTRLGRLARLLWHLRARRLPLLPALAAWQAYRADFDSRPETWDSEDTGGGRQLKAPWIYSIVCFIEQYSNMSEREIFTAPLGLMLWKAETIAERNGISVAELLTEEEIQIAAEQAAAIAEQGGA